jgi:hypothetical protein
LQTRSVTRPAEGEPYRVGGQSRFVDAKSSLRPPDSDVRDGGFREDQLPPPHASHRVPPRERREDIAVLSIITWPKPWPSSAWREALAPDAEQRRSP